MFFMDFFSWKKKFFFWKKYMSTQNFPKIPKIALRKPCDHYSNPREGETWNSAQDDFLLGGSSYIVLHEFSCCFSRISKILLIFLLFSKDFPVEFLKMLNFFAKKNPGKCWKLLKNTFFSNFSCLKKTLLVDRVRVCAELEENLDLIHRGVFSARRF